MKRITCLLLAFIPMLAIAQKPLFVSEFNKVNSWFFSKPQIMLEQKYFYYNDTSMLSPADSAVCTITKSGTSIHYDVIGLESFSDNGYMVKISHTQKSMYVSKTAVLDTATLSAIFNEGFSGFNIFSRSVVGTGIVEWKLSDGVAGVKSAILLMDVDGHQIKSLQMNIDADNVLTSPYQKDQPSVIKIIYQYNTYIPKSNSKKLSDFITISDSSISPAEKYKNYDLKLIAETK